MKKYWSVFKISFQQEIVFRANFVIWRIRSVLQIFLIFFLWDSVFSDPDRVVFGYDRQKILTYVFGVLVVRAFVLSTRATGVVGEIASGDLSNYLLKPVNYFNYWLTRDLSSKVLNFVFAVVEVAVLFVLLRPQFFIQTDPVFALGFLISLVLALLIFFTVLFITSFVVFWLPEMGWPFQFLVVAVFTEFLSGALFPLDILPAALQRILFLTPFPYLIFFPLQVYLEQVSPERVIQGIGISAFWLAVLWFLMNFVWRRGLAIYRAEGR